MYYGDAQAHLNISRSLVDSRTPGYDQLGTVWLPMLHVLCLPFVQSSRLWSTGLAGTIPVALCFVAAGTLLFLSSYKLHGACSPALVAVACFALNPNILYLSVIPMTEIVFLAGSALLLYSAIQFRSTNRASYLVLGGFASNWMSLTRYDGWFLIPFAAALFAWLDREHRRRTLLTFLMLAGLSPIYWMAHSWWETANALDFFNGPYSAAAIQHGQPYPGWHDWPNAFLYYGTAARLCSGWGLTIVAMAGVAVTRRRTDFLFLGLLVLPCVFYIWSIHSSGNPIHVPGLWPFSYYNTRYGISFTFFAAFAAGFSAQALSSRPKWKLILPLIAIAPWLFPLSSENWICWKESEVNSNARRAWTAGGSEFLLSHRQPGELILAPFGDVAGIFCRAGIPLAQVLHEGNGPMWSATILRPDLLHPTTWAVAREGDTVDQALSSSRNSSYQLVKIVSAPENARLHIYKRSF